jgi:hypothetical protein
MITYKPMTASRLATMPRVLSIIHHWRDCELRAAAYRSAIGQERIALVHDAHAAHYRSIAIGLASRDDIYMEPVDIYLLVTRSPLQ